MPSNPDMGPIETIAYIRNKHFEFCEVLRKHLHNVGGNNYPKCIVTLAAYNRAGVYYPSQETCIYSLPYAMLNRDKYDWTIAHEACHHYQYITFRPAKWHGDYWKYLLGSVCKQPFDTYHSYSVRQAKAMGKCLRMIPIAADQLDNVTVIENANEYHSSIRDKRSTRSTR